MTGDPAGVDVDAVSSYVAGRTGLSFEGRRRAQLLGQLADAVSTSGTRTAAAYVRALDRDAGEFDRLVSRLTVGESYFFREPAQLEVLRQEILPERREARGDVGPVRLWSAGCSFGQEPHTLAMVLEEEGLAARARVVATDISATALAGATTGTYPAWSLRATTPAQAAAYFRPVAGRHAVVDRLRRRVTFRQLNLLDPLPHDLRSMDVVFCRNVLMYLSLAAIDIAAERLTSSLAPGGWLVTGTSDPPLRDVDGLEPVATSGGVMYRRRVDAGGRPHRGRVAPLTGPARRLAPPRSATPAQTVDAVMTDAATIHALGDAGDLPAALAAADAGVDRLPLDAEIRFLQAVVLLEMGRPERSAHSARAALFLDPDLVVAHLALGRAEAALGNVAAARRCFRNGAAQLRALPGEAVVPLTGGDTAGRLVALALEHERRLGTGGPR